MCNYINFATEENLNNLNLLYLVKESFGGNCYTAVLASSDLSIEKEQEDIKEENDVIKSFELVHEAKKFNNENSPSSIFDINNVDTFLTDTQDILNKEKEDFEDLIQKLNVSRNNTANKKQNPVFILIYGIISIISILLAYLWSPFRIICCQNRGVKQTRIISHIKIE